MNEMDANDFDNEGLLRFTRNDRRKRGVVTMAIVRGSLKKGDCFRQGLRNGNMKKQRPSKEVKKP